jgi:hypothetical protein
LALVDTLRRPDIHRPQIGFAELVADALLIVGFVQMVLGIYEIGGLLNLGVGFAIVWAGAVAAFADMTRRLRDEEEAFFRIADNL